jgi:hypothetical protein
MKEAGFLPNWQCCEVHMLGGTYCCAGRWTLGAIGLPTGAHVRNHGCRGLDASSLGRRGECRNCATPTTRKGYSLCSRFRAVKPCSLRTYSDRPDLRRRQENAKALHNPRVLARTAGCRRKKASSKTVTNCDTPSSLTVCSEPGKLQKCCKVLESVGFLLKRGVPERTRTANKPSA